MKLFTHKAFQKNNQLTGTAYPDPLKEKISIFDKLLSRLTGAKKEESKKIHQKLKELDREIYTDLLEFYADELENNEYHEDEKPQRAQGQAASEEAKKTKTDEDILEELYKMGRTKNLRRSLLRDLGIKTSLGLGNVRIGRFTLSWVFSDEYKYNLSKHDQ